MVACCGTTTLTSRARTGIDDGFVAHLVRRWCHAAILSADPFRVLVDAPVVGSYHDRVSPHKHRSPRHVCLAADDHSATARGSRCVPRRRHLRAASGRCGIRRVDDRAQEHVVGRVLPRRGIGIPSLRCASRGSGVCGIVCFLCPGIAGQDGDGSLAGGAARRFLVEAWKHRRAARRASAGAVLRHWRCGWCRHRLVRAHSQWRARIRVPGISNRASADCGTGDLLLSCQADLAGLIDVHLSAMEHRRGAPGNSTSIPSLCSRSSRCAGQRVADRVRRSP